MKHARRVTQGVFLVVFFFLFLQTESKGTDELGYPVKLFIDFDPLIFLSTILSSHTLAAALYLSIILIVLTMLLGRVFCGWVCPLGTLNNIIGSMKRWPPREKARNWFRVKYYILFFILASSLFTMQLVGIMDPLSLVVRSFSLSIYPAFNYSVNAALDAAYKLNVKGITTVADYVYEISKKTVLAFQQPYFTQGVFVGLLFIGILALNLVERRFWCRYLCPLGALLGLLSRYPLLKRTASEGCNACGACEYSCQGNAKPGDPGTWMPTECLYCWNCDDMCPRDGVSFRFSIKKAPAKLDLGRRKVLASALAGAAAVPLFRATPVFKSGYPDPGLIRPPGALEEREFLAKCVKCGECMKVCTTNGLQPTLFEAGAEGIWSPMLVPRIGYCEYKCTLCGQVCPTGAIQKLAFEDKAKVKIGTAMVDRSRCLPFAHAIPCIVCEEMCPLPKKAIWFEETRAMNRDGKPVEVKQPHVDLELCTGCGICETKCPLVGKPGIYITSIGETRSKENQLLLGSRESSPSL